MTSADLNLAIAKSEGWNTFLSKHNYYEVTTPTGERYTSDPWTCFDPYTGKRNHTPAESEACSHIIPNYCEDLNLLHELELKLNQKEDAEYRHKYLPEVVGGCLATCITATALQRAEAYAKVKGIWNDKAFAEYEAKLNRESEIREAALIEARDFEEYKRLKQKFEKGPNDESTSSHRKNRRNFL